MKNLGLILVCAGIIVAIFSSNIDNAAKNNIIVKNALIVLMIILVLCIGITLYNVL